LTLREGDVKGGGWPAVVLAEGNRKFNGASAPVGFSGLRNSRQPIERRPVRVFEQFELQAGELEIW